jgi:hypothetical protein
LKLLEIASNRLKLLEMREERRLSNEKGENKTRRKREKKKMID